VESYNQADVSGLARVFTGWDLNLAGYTAPYPHAAWRRPMVQTAAGHESGSKVFLGTTIPAGTNGVDSLRIALDTLFNHPNLPPFVGRQLIQRLVTSNPSPAYVARVAAAFANNGAGVRGDMRPRSAPSCSTTRRAAPAWPPAPPSASCASRWCAS